MPEPRSKAHYKMAWEEEVRNLERLKFSANAEDSKKITEIQEQLREIIDRTAEQSIEQPEICPECNNEDYFCAYRKDCPIEDEKL